MIKVDLPNRQRNRLNNYNYNQNGAYFITVCVKDRKKILSIINVGTGVLDCPKIELLKHGKTADKYINQLNNFYKNISIDKYVIMPDHIHLLISIQNELLNGQSRTPVPTNKGFKNDIGELNIRISVLIKLRKIYNCSYDDFFNGLEQD